MKLRFLTAIALVAMAFTSCSENTEGIGNSLTDESDKLVLSTGVFSATTRSIIADSVFTRESSCYLGKVRDPETQAHVKSDFMAQFNMVEGFSLPDISKIVSKENGEAVADSCNILIFLDIAKSYGDTLTAMKMKVTELSKPIEEPMDHYSNVNLRNSGYLRSGGVENNLMYTFRDETLSDSVRNLIISNIANQSTIDDDGNYDLIRVRLNDPYTDQEGNTYKNYGSYLMQSYYKHPEYFTNSYRFIHKVCPGFFFESTDGLGLMSSVYNMEIRTFYRYQSDTTTTVSSFTVAATSEVLKTSIVTNDREALQRLVDNENCTYIKSPAGIFTEVTLPVDEITSAHTADSLLSVSISFQRENSLLENTEYQLGTPSTVLMVQKDSLYSFFEDEKVYNNKSAFMATLSSSNVYTYSNIGNLITLMKQNKENGLKSDPNWVSNNPDWNKAVLVPVSVTYSGTTSAVTSVTNQMSLSSTKLVGGTGNPIKVEVIYAKFRDN